MASGINAAPVFSSGRSGLIDGSIYGYGRILNDIASLPDGKSVAVDYGRLYRFNEDGSPDSSLGYNGVLHLGLNTPGHGWVEIKHVVPLSDGKYLVSGSGRDDTNEGIDNSLFVARVNHDGSRDATFNQGLGKVLMNPGTSTYDDTVAMSVLDDGKVLVAASSSGISGNGSSTSDPQYITLARLLPDGSPDRSFGNNGIIVAANPHARPNDMIVQADGKILVVATDLNSGTYYQFKLFRFNVDGTPDKGFGVGGELTTSFKSSTYNKSASGINVAIQADGKIVAVGSAPPSSTDPRLQSGFAVVRYNTDGSLDTTFSGDGKFNEYVASDQGTWQPIGARDFGYSGAHDLHISDDGSILVAGVTFKGLLDTGKLENQVAMIRLHANGTLDTTFGANGYVTTASPAALPTESLDFAGLVVDAEGRIMIGGAVNLPGVGLHPFVARYLPDGPLDPAFGKLTTSLQNSAVYLAGHPEQFLNGAIVVNDSDVDSANGGTYAGSSVKLVRASGASPQDNFVAGGQLRFENGRALLGDIDIGSVQSAGGSLHINFNQNATQVRVNQALQSIAYDNNDFAQTPRKITIDWTFSDGLAAAKFSTALTIEPAEVPYWIDALLDRRSEGQTADQLRQSLQSFVGFEKNLAVRFDASGSGVFSTIQKQLIEGLLNDVESSVGINFGATGIPLSITNSTELDAGEGAATPLTRTGGGAYLALLADSAAAENSAVVLNALAHALGLKDGDKPSANGSILPFEERDQDFGDLEIAALQFLYGPNKLARAGNDIYRIDADVSNFIWDGAGSDTVSGENITADLTLHLEPGYWDYIGSQNRVITAAGQITVNYGSAIENAIGGSGNDRISGTGAANTLTGGAGNDRLEGLGGNDRLDGGVGIDTAVFGGARSAYTVKQDGTGFTVTYHNAIGGTDSLRNMERIQFRDGMLAIDLDGSAGQAYRLYKAVFGREPDAAGLGYWIAAMDRGMSSDSVAKLFMTSAEFATQYGAQPDSTKLITTLYKNVLHREPDAGGFDWWRGMLDDGKIAAADALLGFSESVENRAQVIGEIQNGIPFTAYYG